MRRDGGTEPRPLPGSPGKAGGRGGTDLRRVRDWPGPACSSLFQAACPFASRPHAVSQIHPFPFTRRSPPSAGSRPAGRQDDTDADVRTGRLGLNRGPQRTGCGLQTGARSLRALRVTTCKRVPATSPGKTAGMRTARPSAGGADVHGPVRSRTGRLVSLLQQRWAFGLLVTPSPCLETLLPTFPSPQPCGGHRHAAPPHFTACLLNDQLPSTGDPLSQPLSRPRGRGAPTTRSAGDGARRHVVFTRWCRGPDGSTTHGSVCGRKQEVRVPGCHEKSLPHQKRLVLVRELPGPTSHNGHLPMKSDRTTVTADTLRRARPGYTVRFSPNSEDQAVSTRQPGKTLASRGHRVQASARPEPPTETASGRFPSPFPRIGAPAAAERTRPARPRPCKCDLEQHGKGGGPTPAAPVCSPSSRAPGARTHSRPPGHSGPPGTPSCLHWYIKRAFGKFPGSFCPVSFVLFPFRDGL